MGKSLLKFFTAVMLISSASHQLHGNMASCCGKFYGTIEALYWKADHDPIFIAQKFQRGGSAPGDREQTYLTGEYKTGVRGRIGYQNACNFFDVAYLYVSPTDHVSQTRGSVNSMFIQGGVEDENTANFVSAKERFRYQNVDVRYGRHFCTCGPCSAFFYGNARWVKLKFSEHLDAISNQNLPWFLEQEADFRGGGVGAGFGARFHLCKGLGIGAQGGLMAILGETRQLRFAGNINTNYTTRFISKTTNWLHTIPGLDVRLSLDYTFICRCLNLSVEVGYELNHYFHALRYLATNIEAQFGSGNIPPFDTQSIGFSGPFASLTLCY